MTSIASPSLANRVAVVTGAATSLAAAVADALASAGASLLLVDRNADGLARRAEAMPSAIGHVADLRDDAALSAIPAAAEAAFGRLDILVNMAAVYNDAGKASTRAQWLDTFDVNLVSAALLSEVCRPAMERQGGGVIVNMASLAGKVPRIGRWTYPASKAALLHLTRSMAVDFAASGIRVNSVSPSWIWSEPLARAFGDDRDAARAAAAKLHILPRFGEAEEVAHAVLFLCSPAASFITGTDLAVDGGGGILTAEGPAPRASDPAAG
jgi:NAD(P)-dependent dehydrogenase (short-subunit alcohol dehydrogenase family)